MHLLDKHNVEYEESNTGATKQQWRFGENNWEHVKH